MGGVKRTRAILTTLGGALAGVGYCALPRCSSVVCRAPEWSVGPILGLALVGFIIAVGSPE